jgi:Tol biopolymer transport system component
VKIGTVTIPGATGAAFSADGKKFAVRQYKNAAIYRVTNNDLTAAIKKAPIGFNMPSQKQGEAIAFSPTGSTLILSSEGAYSPVLKQISPV